MSKDISKTGPFADHAADKAKEKRLSAAAEASIDTHNESVSNRTAIRALITDLGASVRKETGALFRLATLIYTEAMEGRFPTEWKNVLEVLKNDFLPERPSKDAADHKAALDVFNRTNQEARRAAIVAVALARVRPNENPFGRKTVLLPAKICGKEFATEYSITSAASVCNKFVNGKASEDVDNVKKQIVRLSKMLNDHEGTISDAANTEIDNLLTALKIHRDRINALKNKPGLVKAS